jgi:hypothetical protein
MRLAKELHPYYPEAWLNAESAYMRCALANVPFGTTLTFCRKHGIEVSSTGHIRLLSLQHYIDRQRSETEQQERDPHPLEDAFFLPEQLNARLEHLGRDRYHLFVNGGWLYAFFDADVLMLAYRGYQRQGHACTVVAAGEIMFYSRRTTK